MNPNSSQDFEVREAVARYLDSSSTFDIDDLYEIVARIAYGEGPPRVAMQVALTLSEFGHGDHDESVVRDRLHLLATQYQTALTFPPAHVSRRHRYSADTPRVAEHA